MRHPCQKTVATRGAGLAALLLLAVGMARAEDGVLAEFAFLDEIPEWGPVGESHVAIDLAGDSARPFALLLDTGAGYSMLTPRYARQVGVNIRRLKDTFYRRSTVLGRDLQFVVDTRSSDTAARTFEAGLVGGNFLMEYVVEVDYAARRVRFLDPRTAPVSETDAEPGAILVPMRLSDLRPTIEVELGTGSAWFLVDTGSFTDLMLSEEKARELGLHASGTDRVQTSRNVLGSERSLVTRLDGVRVGGLEVSGVDLAIVTGEGSSYRITNLAGQDAALLGNAFLRRFRVRFDYPHRKLALFPRPDAGPSEPEAAPTTEASAPGTPSLPEVASAAPARPAAPVLESVHLELEAPDDGASQAGRVGWTEVRGFAASHRSRDYDVVIALDLSGSTAYASGVDVDADGRLGKARRRRENWRSFNPRHLCSDPGDTILDAEIEATRKLVEVLDPERTRIGLVTFADRGALHAPVGSDRARFEELLEKLRDAFGSGATNFAHPTRLATEALLAASEGEPDATQRVLLFLSDGYPTFPGSEEQAAEEALEAAREAAAAGVRIYTFGLGAPGEEDDSSDPEHVFVRMAEVSQGRHLRLSVPGEVIRELPRVDLARVASVEVVNATSGAAGRATRIFPDGSFDAFLELVPGENRIVVTARGERGAEESVERRVFFDQREPVDEEEARRFEERLERLRADLRLRTTESELYLQTRTGRGPGQERELDVRVEETER